MVAWRGQLSRLSIEVAQLQDWAVSLANIPVGEAASTFPQLSRFLSRKLDKDVTFEMSGTDIMVDRQIVDLIREPLRHLVVNAIDHGIEAAAERLTLGKPATGTVTLAAEIRDERLIIEGPTADLEGHLLHYTDPDFRHYLKKLARHRALLLRVVVISLLLQGFALSLPLLTSVLVDHVVLGISNFRRRTQTSSTRNQVTQHHRLRLPFQLYRRNRPGIRGRAPARPSRDQGSPGCLTRCLVGCGRE